MKRRRAVVLGVTLLLFGCEDAPPPNRPTPIPTSGAPAPAPSPERSFSLWGFVGDTAARELVGSRVEVVDSRGGETVTTTDGHGHFLLPGPFTGTLRITASHEGHLPQTKTYALPATAPATGATGSVSFGLELPGGSAQILGDFTVRLTADPTCAGLPDDLRTRTYSATITNGDVLNSFTGRLSGARFFSWTPNGWPSSEVFVMNRFWLGTAGQFVGGYISIIEQVSDTSYLIVDGRIGGSSSSAGATASLNGYLDYCPAQPVLVDQGVFGCRAGSVAYCHSENHQIALTRR